MKEQLSAYRQSVSLPYGRYDLSTHLMLSELALVFQEIAGDDCERMGLGRRFMLDNGIFWVISRLSLRLSRPVRWREAMEVTTWYGEPMRYIFPRGFAVESQQGECLVQADSAWMLIDREKREVVFPSRLGLDLPLPPADMPKARVPGRMSMDIPLERSVLRRPLYSDFDLNGHMNNARYLAWICDLFGPERYLARYIDALQVNFVQEIMEGEDVELAFGERGDAFAVRASVEGVCRFEAAGSFAPLQDG